MTLWPRTLLARLLIIVLLGLLLANALSLTLVMVERMRNARSVMLGNLENDVATSVAILDRLPAKERPEWLERLSRGNYRYILGPGEPGAAPTDKRSRDAVRTLKETLSSQYPLRFTAVPGPISHIQAHLTLRDGAPLTIDLIPRMPPVASGCPWCWFFSCYLSRSAPGLPCARLSGPSCNSRARLIPSILRPILR